MKLKLNLLPFYGLFVREVSRFLKVVFQTVISPLISTVLYLLIFGVSIGSRITIPGYDSYLHFLIPGLIAMGLIRNAFENITSSLVAAKYVNELQDLRTAPLSTSQIIGALVAASTVRGMAVAALTYCIGFVFCLSVGSMLPIAHPFLLLIYTLLAGVAFSLLGLIVAMNADSFEKINVLGGFILVPLIYLGGVFFSLEMLHPFWQRIAQLNPIYYVVGGIRYSITGHDASSFLVSLFVFVIFLSVLYPLTYYAMSKGENYVR